MRICIRQHISLYNQTTTFNISKLIRDLLFGKGVWSLAQPEARAQANKSIRFYFKKYYFKQVAQMINSTNYHIIMIGDFDYKNKLNDTCIDFIK